MDKPTDPNVIIVSMDVQGNTSTMALHPWSKAHASNVEQVALQWAPNTELLMYELLENVVPILTGIPLDRLNLDYRVLLYNPASDTYKVAIIGQKYRLGGGDNG